jgi:hypothetical protein
LEQLGSCGARRMIGTIAANSAAPPRVPVTSKPF